MSIFSLVLTSLSVSEVSTKLNIDIRWLKAQNALLSARNKKTQKRFGRIIWTIPRSKNRSLKNKASRCRSQSRLNISPALYFFFIQKFVCEKRTEKSCLRAFHFGVSDLDGSFWQFRGVDVIRKMDH